MSVCWAIFQVACGINRWRRWNEHLHRVIMLIAPDNFSRSTASLSLRKSSSLATRLGSTRDGKTRGWKKCALAAVREAKTSSFAHCAQLSIGIVHGKFPHQQSEFSISALSNQLTEVNWKTFRSKLSGCAKIFVFHPALDRVSHSSNGSHDAPLHKAVVDGISKSLFRPSKQIWHKN